MNNNNNKTEYESRQIAKVQTAKKLVEFNDQLVVVKPNKYAKVHAGTKEGASRFPSRVGVKILDYSNGTGDKTVTLTANLRPTDVAFLLEMIKKYMQQEKDYKWMQQRIHEVNTNKQTGLAPVQTLTIERQYKTSDGTPRRCPWKIQIENGTGIPQKTQNGGTQIQPKSYQREAFAFMMISDEDMFTLFYDTQRFITLWEQSCAIPVIREAKKNQNNTK